MMRVMLCLMFYTNSTMEGVHAWGGESVVSGSGHEAMAGRACPDKSYSRGQGWNSRGEEGRSQGNWRRGLGKVVSITCFYVCTHHTEVHHLKTHYTAPVYE